ncbi:hypothetical protein [Ovoidimarina sediminis]|uniref:hypothetical protein n=1 Tax=Ovoidimarina sediminis TaxID=3079856 RepID=UPI002906879C|nr:hypothetical protein [Rhodophyticola sp. MJ-SS7]MDU8946504.1 hypothetical protein [Rhodophyticola sp. MJ-SS7]
MKVRDITGIIVVCSALAFASAAAAEHSHFVETPGKTVSDVGSGQTSISDASHGGFHKFHENVHIGKPGTATSNPRNPVKIGKN